MRRRMGDFLNKKKGFGMQGLTGLLMSAAVVFGVCFPSHAQEIDLNKKGSITLTLNYKNETTNEVLPMTEGAVTVYEVSKVVEDNGYKFDTSTGVFASETAVQELGDINSKLAAENARMAEVMATLLEGKTAAAGPVAIANGSVRVDSLEPGLYLMVQTTRMVVTSETGTNVEVFFNPFLFSIPFDAEGSLNYDPAHTAAYEYDVSSTPKVYVPPVITGNKPPEDETKPSEGTEPPTTPSTNPPGGGTPPSGGNRLPQTGQLWWPVPILALSGILLSTIGVMFRRRAAL